MIISFKYQVMSINEADDNTRESKLLVTDSLETMTYNSWCPDPSGHAAANMHSSPCYSCSMELSNLCHLVPEAAVHQGAATADLHLCPPALLHAQTHSQPGPSTPGKAACTQHVSCESLVNPALYRHCSQLPAMWKHGRRQTVTRNADVLLWSISVSTGNLHLT